VRNSITSAKQWGCTSLAVCIHSGTGELLNTPATFLAALLPASTCTADQRFPCACLPGNRAVM
jgi:hypothetical protein